MSQSELVDAYVQGRMSRRTLIRRLAAAGVSFGAAAAYAHLLRPQPATARRLGDLHGPSWTGRLIVQDLDKVIEKRRVKVEVTTGGPASRYVFLHLYRASSPFPDVVIGEAELGLPAAGTQTLQIPITNNPVRSPYALKALRRRKRKARLGLSFYDGDDPNPFSAGVFRR